MPRCARPAAARGVRPLPGESSAGRCCGVPGLRAICTGWDCTRGLGVANVAGCRRVVPARPTRGAVACAAHFVHRDGCCCCCRCCLRAPGSWVIVPATGLAGWPGWWHRPGRRDRVRPGCSWAARVHGALGWRSRFGPPGWPWRVRLIPGLSMAVAHRTLPMGHLTTAPSARVVAALGHSHGRATPASRPHAGPRCGATARTCLSPFDVPDGPFAVRAF